MESNISSGTLSLPLLENRTDQLEDTVLHMQSFGPEQPSIGRVEPAMDVGMEQDGDDRSFASYRKLSLVCSNYQEAAIYLNEGIYNEKFNTHPSTMYRYYGYLILHHRLYYTIFPLVAVSLLLLTLFEEPTFVEISPKVTPFIELFLLSLLLIDVVLKVMWQTPKRYLRKRLSLLKCAILFLSLVEAIVILGRNSQSFNITRALRPVFLLDTQVMTDVKRVLHQIQKCLGPIFDVLCYIFFIISLVGASGYYVFGSTPELYQFETLGRSIINLFFIVINANFPGLLLDRYRNVDYSPVFGVLFILWCVATLSVVLLAIITSSFVIIQKNKFKSLYIHRRNALRRAFDLLQTNGSISFSSFIQLMFWYAPRTSVWKSLCFYKAMTQNSGSLGIDEFYSFYDVEGLSWRRVNERGEIVRWYSRLSPSIASKFTLLTKIVIHPSFRITLNVIVLINVLYFYIFTSYVGKGDPEERLEKPQKLIGINIAFVIIYIIEAMVKMVALGPLYYFQNKWNVLEFTVAIFSFIIDVLQGSHPELVVLTPVRFIRLVRFNQSVFLLFLIVYYFFAVIGMQTFNGEVFKGCCNSSNVAVHYSGDTNTSNTHFYVLTFDSLPQSFITLFEVMVGVDWWILVEGFSLANDDENTRVYFLAFMVTTSVLYTVSLAFILQAFVYKVQLDISIFRIRPDEDDGFGTESEGQDHEVYRVALSKEEVSNLETELSSYLFPRRMQSVATMPDDMLLCEGKRHKTKADLLKQLYFDDLQKWIEEDQYILHRAPTSNYLPPSKTGIFKKLKIGFYKLLAIIKYTLEYIFV
ncbi:two pore calcium channel protein 1-like isoform X2 [Dysidea avara]|uniref:two pore calcium channel protein 1-like isoform X2 n=1 Tax=Dysidea avara TaxID=196820 RepID=UPI00331E3E46